MKTRLSLLALPALVAAFVVMPELHAQTPTAARAAQRLIEATAPAQRGALLLPFTEAVRSDWHYTPRRRDGLTWKAMSTAQREATTALLRTALNERGLDKVRAVMALEITLRQLEAFGFSRDPENYALAIYGEPGVGGWGWRIEGHHLSLHFSLESGGPLVRLLPRATGARESRWVDLLSPAAESVNVEPRREQDVGVAPAPDWRAELEQLRAELQALRERVQQLENRGPLG